MWNIETFPSKQIYLYLSLVEKNVAEFYHKGWLAIAKLKPLSLSVSPLSMPKKAFDNVKIEK